jgi:hypothetical protein
MTEQKKTKKGNDKASQKRNQLFRKFSPEVKGRFESGEKKMSIDKDLVKKGAPRFFIYYCLARLGKLEELVESNRVKIIKQIAFDTGTEYLPSTKDLQAKAEKKANQKSTKK